MADVTIIPVLVATKHRSAARRVLARAGAVTAAAALLLGLGAGTAFAHVTVNPGTATAGGYAKLTFRVPTESDTASTVKIRIALPTDHPFASVSTQPVPGWTASRETIAYNPPLEAGKFTLDEATSAVTWTADDGVGVKPGEFQEFSLSVGPVPDVPSLVFPATQTYSDGTVVEWKDVAAAGVDPHSLDHPAPVLTITAADAHSDGHDAASSVKPAGTDAAAELLGAVALVLAAVALVIAALAYRRSRTSAPRSGTARTDDDAAPAPDAVPAPGTADTPDPEPGR